jgi:predicted acetyltransferase
MAIEVRPLERDRLADLMVPISVAFGAAPSLERVERFGSVPELQLLLGAFEEDDIVGSAGAFTFDMTVPGGVSVETSGTSVVAVLPTHRRRGILRRLMRGHLDEAHRRGQAVAALFASEGSIYGRFGYGLAALRGEMDLRRERTAFAPTLGPARARESTARVRLVGEAEAAAAFPLVWERVRLSRPGMLSRSDTWWRVRRTADPEWLRAGRPPLQRVLVELDGRPAAYALYRLGGSMGPGLLAELPLDIVEALGDSPEATRALWRYLFGIDVIHTFRATQIPADHPLLFLLAEPARLQIRLGDGLWVRLVDVAAALSRRGYAEGPPLVLEVEDAFCPWNTGRYRLAAGLAERTRAEPDLALHVDALGAVYLGGFGFTELAQAGRVVERAPGALRRGDALFRGELLPWCPEIF